MEIRRSSGRKLARDIAKKGNTSGKAVVGGRIKQRGTNVRTQRLDDIASGKLPMPTTKAEQKSLARAAGKAAHGKGNPAWEAAFKHLWYHDPDHWNAETGQYEL